MSQNAFIVKLRSHMIKVKEGKSYSDQEVIKASQKLDVVLNEYQARLMWVKMIEDDI